jgi:hypothetical protein
MTARRQMLRAHGRMVLRGLQRKVSCKSSSDLFAALDVCGDILTAQSGLQDTVRRT